MSFAQAKCLSLVCGVGFLMQGAWAAVQTTPYIALHSQPKYANFSKGPDLHETHAVESRGLSLIQKLQE